MQSPSVTPRTHHVSAASPVTDKSKRRFFPLLHNSHPGVARDGLQCTAASDAWRHAGSAPVPTKVRAFRLHKVLAPHCCDVVSVSTSQLHSSKTKSRKASFFCCQRTLVARAGVASPRRTLNRRSPNGLHIKFVDFLSVGFPFRMRNDPSPEVPHEPS